MNMADPQSIAQTGLLTLEKIRETLEKRFAGIFVFFMLAMTLCGSSFAIPGETLLPAHPQPAAPTISTSVHSDIVSPTLSLSELDGPSNPLSIIAVSLENAPAVAHATCWVKEVLYLVIRSLVEKQIAVISTTGIDLSEPETLEQTRLLETIARIHTTAFSPDSRALAARCQPQADSPIQNIKTHQTAPISPSNPSSIGSSQPPFFRPSMLPEETMGTPTADSLVVPTEAGDANLQVDSTEGIASPQAEDDDSLANGNEFQAGSVSMGQQAKGLITLTKVPLVNQQNYTSCGEAAFAMSWNYRHPDRLLDIGSVETTGLEIGVYFPAHHPGPHGYLGTSPSGMEAIGDYEADQYGQLPPTVRNIDLDRGDMYAQWEARGLLYSQLSAGNPVIIEVTDIIGSPSKTYNDSHYVIVTGMNFDTGRVTYNDPYINFSMGGRYSGYSRSAEWGDIWTSWSTNKDINPGEDGHPGRGWYMVVH